MKLNKAIIYWAVFVVYEHISLLILIISKFNSNFCLINFYALGILSSIAILSLKNLSSRVKLAMAFTLPLKYFFFGTFALFIPLFGDSEIPIYIFCGLYVVCLLGPLILLRFSMGKSFCPECGDKMTPSMTSCGKCGHKLKSW